MSVTSTYTVAGMSCSHCVAAVTQELSSLADVTRVAVDLATEGDSRVHVTSAARLDIEQVRDAVHEAGYELTGVQT